MHSLRAGPGTLRPSTTFIRYYVPRDNQILVFYPALINMYRFKNPVTEVRQKKKQYIPLRHSVSGQQRRLTSCKALKQSRLLSIIFHLGLFCIGSFETRGCSNIAPWLQAIFISSFCRVRF